MDSIDVDHSTTISYEEYEQNVKRLSPNLAPMAAHMFSIISKDLEEIDFIDFCQAAFPLIPLDKIRAMHLKHFPAQPAPVRLTALEKLSQSQKEEIQAIVQCWDDDKN